MTESTTMSLAQLQYCPLCRHLIRPSMFANNEATQKDGVYYHAACLSKGDRASGRVATASQENFDDDDGAKTDFQNYDKVVVESITAMRSRTVAATGAPAGVRTGGTGSHAAIRRKTTTSAATASARLDDPPAARRSSMVLRSYSDPHEKKSPAGMIGAIVGAMVLIAIGGFFLLRSGPAPTPPINTAATEPIGPLVRNVPPSVTPPPVATPRPADPVLPAATTPDTGPSPYDIAKTTNPPATPVPAYEPAGAAVAWLDGTGLGEWKVIKSVPNAVTVVEGAIEINPGTDPAVLEHPASSPDFNLAFEARIGDGNGGAYMELWAGGGTLKMTGADFQSAAWTPVRVEVRGGKVAAVHGTKGPGNEHPGFVDPTSVAVDRNTWMAGRPVVMLFVSTACTKSIRNVQFTPMRPVPVVAAPTPPTTVPVTPPAKTPLVFPVTILGSQTDNPLGAWRRAKVETEGDKSYLTWEQTTTAAQFPFFEWTGVKGTPPELVRMQIKYRVRNSDAKVLSVRFWNWISTPAEVTIDVPAADAWQEADVTVKCPSEPIDQIEVRLQGNVLAATRVDILSIILTPAVVPVVPPVVQPTPPAPPKTEVPILAFSGKNLVSEPGEWKSMESKSEAGKDFVSWVSSGKSNKFPYLKLANKTLALPATIKVRAIYRVNNLAGAHIAVRTYLAGNVYRQGLLPVGTKGAWQENECTITGITGTTSQFELRTLEAEPAGATIDCASLVVTDATGNVIATNPVATTPPPVTPPAAAPVIKLECAALEEGGGTWKRFETGMEKGRTFLRWASSTMFPYFANTSQAAIPVQAHVKVTLRLKSYNEKFLYLRVYANGSADADTAMTLSAPDADGWRVAEAYLKNTYTVIREFEIKPAGALAATLVMEVDSVEFLSTAVANPAPVPDPNPTSTPAPAPAAGGGTLLFRLEGLIQEKFGRWNRVQDSTVDGRTILSYSDTSVNHPPAFMSFQNPNSRAMPTRIRSKICYRVNKPIGNLRVVFGIPGGKEEVLISAPVNAAEVGKWVEAESTISPSALAKDEIYLKFGAYPEGMVFDIDWLEVYDLTAPAAPAVNIPTPVPGGATPPTGTPGQAVPAGPKPGTRLFAQPAGSKKLTKPETKIILSPLTTSTLATGGATSRLFDGDCAGGIFAITSTDPKTAECWLVIDLGAMCAVDGIKVFNFFSAERTYGAQVWQVSAFDDFLREVVTVYNADTANVHRQGAGTDPGGKAVKEGQQAFFAPVRGRYVRIWLNGNNDNKDNHLLEIEVYGNDSAAGIPVAPHLAAGDLKINAGRGALGDWVSEGAYVGNGVDQTDAKPVALPGGGLLVPDKLYNTYRGGMQVWNFPKLPDGNYWVRLHFSEPTLAAAGARLFDVVVNEEVALKGYDIFANAGGAHRAVVETVATTAMGGKGIKVEMKTVKGAPALCGIEILPTDGPLAAPARVVAPAAPAAAP